MKNNLTAQRLVSAGATKVGTFQANGEIYGGVEFVFPKGKTKDDLAKQGLYVIVRDGVAVARTYVGYQECAKGFNDTVNRVLMNAYTWNGDAAIPHQIYRMTSYHGRDHVVYHVPVSIVSRLLSVQQLELFEENCAKYQALTSVSRQLFKTYNFEYQKR